MSDSPKARMAWLVSGYVKRMHFCGKRFWICLAFVVTAQFGLLMIAIVKQSSVSDEYAHFYAGLAYLKNNDTRVFNVNPPVIRSLAMLPSAGEYTAFSTADWSPPARCEFLGGRELFNANPHRYRVALRLGRSVIALFAVMGTVVIGIWARQISGDHGGLISSVFWAFQPQVVAHGSLITNDIPVASCMILASWTFCLWFKNPNWLSAGFVCLALSLATLCKFSALILWPVFSAFCLSALVRGQGRKFAVQPLVSALFAILIISVAYRVDGFGTPLRDLDFISQTFLSISDDLNFQDGWLGTMPMPLPEQFVMGLDRQQMDFETGLSSYAMGKRSDHGWWWFYLYSMAVKLPSGTLLAIAAVGLSWFRSVPRMFCDNTLLLTALFVVIGITAFKSGFAQQHRYVFPAYPFLFVLLATPFSCNNRQACKRFVELGLVLSLAGTLWSAPNWMGAFNLVSGGTNNGQYHLFNDATDWGQDRDQVVEWVIENPKNRPLLIYSTNSFSNIAPSAIGLPSNLGDSETEDSVWYLVSKTDLVMSPELFERFFHRVPDQRIGATHLVYRIRTK